MLDLQTFNQQKINQHFNRRVQQAFNLSKNKEYKMQRQYNYESVTSLNYIPSVYDLNHQNIEHKQLNLIKIDRLIQFNRVNKNCISLENPTKLAYHKISDMTNLETTRQLEHESMKILKSNKAGLQIKKSSERKWNILFCCNHQNDKDQQGEIRQQMEKEKKQIKRIGLKRIKTKISNLSTINAKEQSLERYQ